MAESACSAVRKVKYDGYPHGFLLLYTLHHRLYAAEIISRVSEYDNTAIYDWEPSVFQHAGLASATPSGKQAVLTYISCPNPVVTRIRDRTMAAFALSMQ